MAQKAPEAPIHNPKLKAAGGKVSFHSVSLLFVLKLAHMLGNRFSLYVLPELGNAMLEGGGKYGRHNFRDAGGRASTYIFATMRHILAHLFRQDIDHDSGVPHVTKAIASLCTLYDIALFGKLEDDRPPPLPLRKRSAFLQELGIGSVGMGRSKSSHALAWEAFVHLALYWEGENDDFCTQEPHLMEAALSLWMLRTHEINGSIIDDREPALRPEIFKAYSDTLLLQFRGIVEKYPNPVAPHTRTHVGAHLRGKKREIYYISGKITNGDQEKLKESLDVFHAAAKKLRAEGKTVFSPAEHERDGWTWEMYLSHFIDWIVKHRPVMYMLRGWKNSLGAKLEHELAKLLGLRIIYEED